MSSAPSSIPKQGTIDGVTPEFMQFFGPIDEKRPKRKERASEVTPPTSSTGASRCVSATVSSNSQPKAVRIYEQYRCIICDQNLSSKGVCKRHLEEQHISPRVFECEGCHAYFDAKASAKKHCSQCGNGEAGWVATKLIKKIYACEFTGQYVHRQDRYIDILLDLSGQKTDRPTADLNRKLQAILKYAGFRDAAITPLCSEISNQFFGSPEAWRELEWDQDFLKAKIMALEHATFHPDGTVESARWGETSPVGRLNTESFLTQLFHAGKRPGHGSQSPSIKPAPMSICSTPMPLAYNPPSVTPGPSSADTPQSATSPMPRSHSRQTVWSHDGMTQSTTASTPQSVPSGDDMMTTELKSKRHLSDESRSFIPTRTPPGPPDLLDHYQYQSDPALQAPQLPPLPDFVTPSNSTISLPLRKQEVHGLPTTQQLAPISQYPPHMYQMHPRNSSHTLTSEVASETSTLAQSYREPEYLDTMSSDYLAWQQQQQFAYQNSHPSAYGYGNYDYNMADDASMVASSINTGNTVGVDYVTELPKMENYSDMDLSNHHTHPGTFYLPNDEDQQRMDGGMR